MVKFSVFNELSLPFKNTLNVENEFINFFKLLKDLEKKQVKKIRIEKSFKECSITESINFQQFMGQLRNGNFKDRLREFLTNQIIKIESPLINDDEIDSLGEKIEPRYIFEGESTLGGLACADIWGTVAISFRSDEKWNNSLIELHKDGAIISIKHISESTHIQIHKDFFDALEECIQLDTKPSNFWERKDELFKTKIIFCDEVEKQIKAIDTVIFARAISILRDIENGTKCLSDFTISGESMSVEQDSKLKKLREFVIDDKKEYFQNHIKNLPNGYRIHYFEKNDKIYIGYIGTHLETKNYD